MKLAATWMDSRVPVAQGVFGSRTMGMGIINQSLEAGYSGLEGSVDEQYRSFNGWPYVAIDRLCTSVSCMSPVVGRIVSSREQLQRRQERQSWSVQDARHAEERETLLRQWSWMRRDHMQRSYGDMMISQGPDVFVEPIEDHLLIDLMASPNDDDTLESLVYETVMYKRLTGEAYWWVIRGENSPLPEQIWCVPNHMIRPKIGARDEDNEQWTITIQGKTHDVADADIIRSKKKSPWGKHMAQSPQAAGGRWVKEGQAISESRYHKMINGGVPDVVLEYTGSKDSAPDFDVLKRFSEEFSQQLGLSRHGSAVPIPPNFKPHVVGQTLREMDFPKSSADNRTSIASLHGVNPFVLGITEGLTYNTVWASYQQYYDITVNPTAAGVAKMFTELAGKFDVNAQKKGVFVHYDDATPQDPDLDMRQDQVDIANGVMDVDERRIKRGLGPKRTPAYATGYIGAGRVPMTDFDEPREILEDELPDDDTGDDDA